jgi:hypothetical protein
MGPRGLMPIEPRGVWRSLPETLRQAIAEDLGQVMREMSDGLGTLQAGSSGPQSSGVVRQSAPHQVITNQGSLKLQYALSQRARELGWREADIDVIDNDLGQSGAGAAHRKGFKDLVARVTLGEIGLVLSMDVTRLARNCSDWYPLLDFCGHRRCLIRRP